MRKAQAISVSTDKTVLPKIYDAHRCDCGESPLWHPLREELFWVDITNHKILMHDNRGTVSVPFSEFVTALAWIDVNYLLAATESGLVSVNVDTHVVTKICPLEENNPQTRSNDGRADPWGGFWVGTMGKNAETNFGKIYRYYGGRMETIVSSITIPNAICFDKARNRAYFADTATRVLYSIQLDSQTGHPSHEPEIFVDFSESAKNIDGAVVDNAGQIWIGVWDGAEVIKLSPSGSLIGCYPTGAYRPTCPAFGGDDYKDLFVTTAAIGLEKTFKTVPEQGRTLLLRNIVQGQPEPRVQIKV